MKTALLRFEALWWMTRIHLSNINMWPAIFGGVAAEHALSSVKLIELVVFTAGAGGALFIVNDILDAEGDEVTAPYLPLPSKLVTKAQAWAGAAGYFVVGVIALVLACGTLQRLGIAAGLTLGTVVLSMVYSKVKDEGVFASVVISLPQTAPAVIAWVLAGGGRPWALALVVVYHLTACVSNNILAALRDVDLDPLVENLTLPVRLGAAKAFRLASIVAYLAFVPIVILAIAVPHGWQGGVPVGAVALGIMLWCQRQTYASFKEEGRGRIQRMADMKTFKTGEYVRHMAVAACFSLPVALVAGLALYLMLRIGARVYAARLIRGGIARSLHLETPASPVLVEG
jgi:4-hydroxybenzoate polyprenyltransferase